MGDQAVLMGARSTVRVAAAHAALIRVKA